MLIRLIMLSWDWFLTTVVMAVMEIAMENVVAMVST